MLFSLGAKAQSVTYVTSGLTAGTPANANAGTTLLTSGVVTISQIGVEAKADGSNGVCLEIANNNNTGSPTGESISISSSGAKIIGIRLTYKANLETSVAKPYIKYGTSSSALDYCDVGDEVTGATPQAVFINTNVAEDIKYFLVTRANNTACGTETATQTTIRVHKIEVYLTGDVTPLPLDLLSFSAKPNALGKSVNLNWKTANEVNTQDFLVERRTDDTEFTTVGSVLSKNVAGTHSYSFTDTKPVVGNSYYRLKQRDKDGKSSYSDIANVKIEGISLSLHPNPVSKELVVSHDYVKQSASLKVVGLDGKTHIKTNSAVGSSSTTINVASLAAGTYLLVHDVNGKSQSQKFIKK
ncbi:MAG: T9SS type A sorting domain-containing protein [Pedobacter sp.]